ncbi:MAG: ABC transporter permease [Chloroflexota bacterium]
MIATIGRHRAGMFGVLLMVVVATIAVLAPVLAPGGPEAGVLRDRLLPPVFAGGSWDHPLGTDRAGRDLLVRIVWGSRTTLWIAIAATVGGGLVGIVAGVVAGWYGRWVDLILGRLADIQQAIPFVILAMAVVAVVGPSLLNLILVLGLASWLFTYRVVRGDMLAARERPWVEAARALGIGDRRILWRQVLPNVLPSIVVVLTLFVPQTILFSAGLSFLGLGVPPPTPEWGRMIADGADYLRTEWWLTLMPSLALIVTVLGITLVGDWVRDLGDPLLRLLRSAAPATDEMGKTDA